MKQAARQPGFTLIEVLVALAVFAIMSALAYGTLSRTLASAEFLGDRMTRLRAVQRAVLMLDQDFMQLAPRPIRNPLGNGLDAVLRTDYQSGFALELTRAGWNNPAAVPRGTQQRVAYRLEEDKLVRYYWPVLDRTLNTEPVAVTLLDGVENIDSRFLEDNGSWSTDWPPQDRPGPLGLMIRPRAVEFILTLADQGEIRRLIEVTP